VVGNAEISARIGREPGWILEMTGIEERRWAAPGETVASMGAAAGRACLDRAGETSVSMLVMSCSTNERRFPGPASSVAHQLGLGSIPAIDLPVASAGSIFALCLACDLARSYGDVLVVAAERMSAAVDQERMDPSSGMLFGDGAGACLVSRKPIGWRAVDWVLHSDGSMADLIQLPLDAPFQMDGMGVIAAASRRIPSAIQEALAKAGVEAAAVDQFLLHQANQNLLARIARSLSVPVERIYSNIRTYGNTSSASMLIAAAEAGPEGRTLCLAGFGAGLHWGALVARRD
jgi:3-oxoacyl-[acyl-carrier-protein] synthase-3